MSEVGDIITGMASVGRFHITGGGVLQVERNGRFYKQAIVLGTCRENHFRLKILLS